MRIDTVEKFNEQKTKHLENLERIRDFVFGDVNNQPQVTNHRIMNKFDVVYYELKEWLDEAYFDDRED